MREVLLYIIQSTLSLCIFYLLYYLLLRKENNHKFVRAYLLISLSISFLIPFISFSFFSFEQETIPVFYLNDLIVDSSNNIKNITNQTSWLSLIDLWILVYSLVSLIILIGLFKEIRKILKLLGPSKTVEYNGYKVVYHQTDLPTFSFMGVIYLAEEDREDEFSQNNILKHELAHIKGFHSLDMIFMELIKVFFWFNPMVYAYKNALILSHEYIADKETISDGDDQPYVNLLVDQTLSNLGLSLGSHFGRKSGILPEWFPFGQLPHNKSITLKRIKMIKNKKKMNKIKYFIPVLAIAVSFFVVSCLEDGTLDEAQIQEASEGEIERVVFEDIENGSKVTFYTKDGEAIETTKEELRETFTQRNEISDSDDALVVVDTRPIYKGGDAKLIEYLANEIEYPKSASSKGIQGNVYVQFVINEDGTVSNTKIIKGIGEGCDEEAIRVVKNMNGWISGKNEGKDVKVKMVVPIKFKLGN